MINRTRYSTIKPSETVFHTSGLPYPDILTFPIQEFNPQNQPADYTLTQADIDRFDLLMSAYYENPSYDDILKFINNISDSTTLVAGDIIKLYDKSDLDKFYLKYNV